MQALHVPSVSIAVIRGDRIAWVEAFGDATPRTICQAGSMSKLVAAVAALRLVQQNRLGLDIDVDSELVSWQVPPGPFTRDHKLTLRGLLSMTGGIDVPGYIRLRAGRGAAEPGADPRRHAARQLAAGACRARPRSAYGYPGGGYEIVQALVEAASRQGFAAAAQRLVLGPDGMADSFFGQPGPSRREQMATGHFASRAELPD
ncbi:MAG TPA: serine hydrolase domain-containing protein [Acetobacteraceae bacterium]|jgi:CubicO group peptidase (beta-lactamase class C family)|nr:serine hydrolase domain-containing protein [Acetobacteraceae bacterium]